MSAFCASCTYVDQAQTVRPEGTSNSAVTPTPLPTPVPEKIDIDLEYELKSIADGVEGEIGIGAVLLETGDAAYRWREGRFPMQSVYKLPIAMAVLKMVDDGKVRLDQQVAITPDDFVRPGFHSPIRNANPKGIVLSVSEIMRFSVSESDGTASDVLLDLAGGPAEVQKYLGSIGVTDLKVANSEKEISRDWDTQYRNSSTPEAAVKLLRVLHERLALSEASTVYLLGLMTETETGRNRLKGKLPDGTVVAHKTGTGGTEKGITGATNDIGIITLPDGRHIAIAVFVKDSAADGPTRERAIAEIANAVWDKWAFTAETPRRGEEREIFHR